MLGDPERNREASELRRTRGRYPVAEQVVDGMPLGAKHVTGSVHDALHAPGPHVGHVGHSEDPHGSRRSGYGAATEPAVITRLRSIQNRPPVTPRFAHWAIVTAQTAPRMPAVGTITQRRSTMTASAIHWPALPY